MSEILQNNLLNIQVDILFEYSIRQQQEKIKNMTNNQYCIHL